MDTHHAAVLHEDQTVTYCGTVDAAHLDAVRSLSAHDGASRHLREDSADGGDLYVLRDDGDLDWYAPLEPSRPPRPHPGGDAAGRYQGEPGPGGGTAVAAGPDYLPGAIRFGGQSIGGAMDHPENPPRAVWHTTESPGGAQFLASNATFLIHKKAEPQVIYDPVTDKVGQFGPMTKSCRAVRNDGERRTNREGRVCIQIEVLGFAASPWTAHFNPAAKPNFRALLAALRAHGIPDVWPAGDPVPTEDSPMPRDRTVWQGRGGHFGHCHVPGNTHWDPGAIDTRVVPGTPPA
jgi:hypothetical protein